ncbi:MAG TPA: PEGA domain-containing protein [Polyangiaceae bacterium]|nr:PEGA domain-containing protein [Polyangiaceae bacterium]
MKAVVFALCMLCAGSAVAEPRAALVMPLAPNSRVGILSPRGSGLSGAAGTAASDTLVRETIEVIAHTLRVLSYEVVTPDQVIVALNDSAIQCERGIYHCEPEAVRRALGLDAVVMPAIWTESDPADLTVEVTLADAVGQARGRLQGGAKARVPALLQQAIQDTESGKAVRVQIDTIPTGAEVRIDGNFVGTSPLTTDGKFAPGPHEVTLARPGYVTTTTHFDVPRGAPDPFVQSAKMDRKVPSDDLAVIESEDKVSPAWDYAVGGALAVAGVALLVAPVRTAFAGDCDAGSNGQCAPAHFGAGSGVQLAGGLLALAAATFTIVAHPIAASLSSDGELHVEVTGSF